MTVFIKLVFVSCSVLIVGCSSMETVLDLPRKSSTAVVAPYKIDTFEESLHLFDPIGLSSRVEERQLQRRFQNLFVLVDRLGNDEEYRGIPKSIYQREILRRFHRSMPRMKLFGAVVEVRDGVADQLLPNSYLPLQVEKRLDLNESLPISGEATLPASIDLISRYVADMTSPTALLILSDWESIDSKTVDAINRLRQRAAHEAGFAVVPKLDEWRSSANSVCVFIVGIGNRKSRSLIDQVDHCGLSEAADRVAQPKNMSSFVERMFYKGPTDDDGDGIFNYLDRCKKTEPGRIIDKYGCDRFVE